MTEDTHPQPSSWRESIGSIAAFVCGLAGLATTLIVHLRSNVSITETPDPVLTVPFLVVTILGAGFAMWRREDHRGLVASGVLMAVTATFLGWVLAGAALILLAMIVLMFLSDG